MKQRLGSFRRFCVKPVLLALLGGALLGPGMSSAASLTVAAAASMTTALQELGSAYEKKTGIRPVFSFGSSGTLSRQIENGAPFDLFISADTGQVDALVKKGLLDEMTVRTYAVGRIGITTRKGSGVSVKTLYDLTAPSIRKIAIANPAFAPYGIAAKEALEAAGLWNKLKAKLVYGENIRQALQFVETGNAEAGICALSLHKPTRLDFSLIDASLHSPLQQSLGVIKKSSNKEAARGFTDFITEKEGREVLRKAGFEVP